MATAAKAITGQAQTAPAEWAFLPPYDGEQGTLWQVWMREKGAAYRLMKLNLRVINYIGRLEASWRGRKWQEITNPHALEDGGIYATKEEAKDLCRIVYQMTGGRKAVTISPVIVGRAYSPERVRAAGDFDPFSTYDFSATEAVKSQATHILIPADQYVPPDVLKQLLADLAGTSRMARPRL